MSDTEKAMKENMKKFSKSRVLRVKLNSARFDGGSDRTRLDSTRFSKLRTRLDSFAISDNKYMTDPIVHCLSLEMVKN